jgi:23S rRNA pseudouridine2605 synthase
VQLHRALAKLGLCSRTEAWDRIRAGRVRVDRRLVTDPLTWVDLERQQIACDEAEPAPKEIVALALHKPRGFVTTRRDERGRRTVYDLLPAGLPWLHPAGRLDADSEGLLILTNDASLSVRLTDPEQHVAKTYHVSVRERPTAQTLDRLRRGITLSDGRTRPAPVRILDERPREVLLEMILTEGRNRQIRRMLAACGHKVRRLVRVAIGRLELGGLAPGQSRRLTAKEVAELMARLKD